MKLVLASALASAAGGVTVRSGDGHPIEKVITMLKELSATAEEEGKSEALAFDQFEHWCAVSIKTVNAAIAGEKETIETLKSQIAGEEKLIEQLTKEIAKLEKEISRAEQAQERAQKIRDEGAELYSQASQDHKDTIKAIGDAQAALEASKNEALLQVTLAKPQIHKALLLADATWPAKGAIPSASLLASSKQRATLTSLLQGQEDPPKDRPDQLAEGDAAAHEKAFSFKSGDVIELLKALKLRFEDELVAIETAETASLNQFALETQARDAALAAFKSSKEEKETTKGDTEESLNTHKQSLQDTEDELAADSKTLDETQQSCSTKSTEWETRSKVRAGEIEAMGVAIEILAKASGVRTDAPSNPVPPPAPVALMFLQLANPNGKQRAVNLLREKAKTLHSKSLQRFVQELSAHMDDPFGEVNNMIEKMIFRLMNEQTDEDNHKHWCDNEVSKTNTSRTQKEEKVEELTAKIDELDAHAAQLTEDIAAADEMVAKITAFVAEATEIRKIGKHENDLAIKDAQDAQTAVANAISVLTQFYKESGMVAKEAWEFVQRGVELPENPSTWDSSYTGVSDPTKQPDGITSVLEKVASDFAEMEADTRAQEAEDQKMFEDEMKAQAIEKAQRSKESEVKAQERGRTVTKSDSLKKQRKHVEGELYAVNQYYKDLGPACLDGDSSYEDRKAARTSEIDALKEAEGILATAFDEPAPTMLKAQKHTKFLSAHH